MKVLIIPDVHLKPWIFDQAEDIMRDKGFDRAVFIGDLVDDWDTRAMSIFMRKPSYDRHVFDNT